MKKEMVEIPVQEYLYILKNSIMLEYLEAGGVDNWEWYGLSLNPEGEQSFHDFWKEHKENLLSLWEAE